MVKKLCERPLFMGCSISVLICFVCSFLDIVGMLTLGLVLLLAFLLLLPFKTKLTVPALVSLITSLVMIGVSIFNYATCYRPAKIFAGEKVVVTGTVDSVSDTSFQLRCKTVELNGERQKVGFVAAFHNDLGISLVPSEKVRVEAVLFDDVYRNESSRYSIMGNASSVTVTASADHRSLSYLVFSSRRAIEKAIPFENEDTSAFVKAIILGDKSDVDGRFLTMFNTVGLSHFMSLSGLHLIFAVAIVDFILSIFCKGYKLRSAVALVAIFFFTFIAGFTVSCVRAAIMMSFHYFGRLIGRVPDSLTSLSFSCFAILIFAPHNICSLSFLLSASATFGIIVLYPCFSNIFAVNVKTPFIGALVRYVVMTFNISLSATVMCLPILAAVFKSVCVAAPVISVIVSVPLQLIFYVGALAVILCFLPYIGTLFSFVGDILFSAVEFIIEKCYYIENITLGGGYKLFYLVLVLFVVLVVGIYVFFRTKKPSSVALTYIGGYAVFCVLLFIINGLYMDGKVTVTFADVGQGNCTVISCNERATLVDCGGSDIRGLKSVFTDNAIKRIDSVALTHVDDDHIGFVSYVLKNYYVDKLIVPFFSDMEAIGHIVDIARDYDVDITVIDKDTCIPLYNGSSLYCYVENSEKIEYIENLSAVYKFQMGKKSALLTGDITVFQEYWFLERGDEFDTDIFLAPHHGSRTSSHQAFIDMCSPEYSVISVGINNRYGHPDKGVVSRLENASKLLSTAECSSIVFRFDSKGYKCLNER